MRIDEKRVIVFLRRKAGLSREQFLRHWGDIHGPLVADQPAFWQYTARYVQNHLAQSGAEPFDGVAVSEQALSAPVGRGFPGEACYLSVIRPDEERFLDFSTIIRVQATARTSYDGPPGGPKLIALVGRAWLDALEESGQDPIVGARRLIVSRFQSVAGSPPDGFSPSNFTAMVEIWAEDVEAVRLELGRIAPDETLLTFAAIEREIGRPVTSPI